MPQICSASHTLYHHQGHSSFHLVLLLPSCTIIIYLNIFIGTFTLHEEMVDCKPLPLAILKVFSSHQKKKGKSDGKDSNNDNTFSESVIVDKTSTNTG